MKCYKESDRRGGSVGKCETTLRNLKKKISKIIN